MYKKFNIHENGKKKQVVIYEYFFYKKLSCTFKMKVNYYINNI